ncbi:uncharacterized protein LY79DRAFT_102542 [Colletotrichum navitas]|uniref:Uncharacterized protein n=1 Tax=Colletotrichum navitas TaxID=681940 RepID=A0AAD8V629_9PEZI|nr:uncharacterized protein LY79DRAFT_102542 [Colletotrichum navitas]KAK1595607.1 hypothetical protein LY79DRAFT_102542 [Colletotrichum navitas]
MAMSCYCDARNSFVCLVSDLAYHIHISLHMGVLPGIDSYIVSREDTCASLLEDLWLVIVIYLTIEYIMSATSQKQRPRGPRRHQAVLFHTRC